MSNHRGVGALPTVATSLLLALVATACGRFAGPIDRTQGEIAATVVSQPVATATTELEAIETPKPTSTLGSSPTRTPAASPSGTESNLIGDQITPDLTVIQHLLDQIDNDLGNDATADTDEGSPQ